MQEGRGLVEHGREPFAAEGLPADYLGQPLEVFDVTVADTGTRVRLVATALQVGLCNAYRQYVPTRSGTPLGPRPGDVVLDCGACIGDFGTLFAALVGAGGAVHLFDPVPLHGRYCRHQMALNPHLAPLLHQLAALTGPQRGLVGQQDLQMTQIACQPVAQVACHGGRLVFAPRYGGRGRGLGWPLGNWRGRKKCRRTSRRFFAA
jgi:hypothetical protein